VRKYHGSFFFVITAKCVTLKMYKFTLILLLGWWSCQLHQLKVEPRTYVSKSSVWSTTYYKLLGYKLTGGSTLILHHPNRFSFRECVEKDSVFGTWSIRNAQLELHPDSTSRWSNFYPAVFELRDDYLFSQQKANNWTIIRRLQRSKK
jgi:hypothetical protein